MAKDLIGMINFYQNMSSVDKKVESISKIRKSDKYLEFDPYSTGSTAIQFPTGHTM